MKMSEHGGGGMSDNRAAGHVNKPIKPIPRPPSGSGQREIRRIARPSNAEIQRRLAMERVEADLPWLRSGETVPSRPRSPHEGSEPVETAIQGIEKARGKVVDATADYLATVIGDPAFKSGYRGLGNAVVSRDRGCRGHRGD